MRPRLRPLALLVGAALAAALVVLAPRIGGTEPTGNADVAAVHGAGAAATEALHRARNTTPERALLLLAVLGVAGAAVALPGRPLTSRPDAVAVRPVPVARVGVRGPPLPLRSTVR
jgi:hypothetical protein